MHWPNVSPRTATPVETTATSVMPGIASTSAWLRTALGLPLIVGGRQTIVGLASGTSRSRAYFFLPVTALRASSRRCGVPITVNSEAGLRSTVTDRVRSVAAFSASSP